MIRIAALDHFDQVGFSPAIEPPHYSDYMDFLSKGYHGGMDYLFRHAPAKRDPQILLNGAKSWISLLSFYDTDEVLSSQIQDSGFGWVSRYARGEDYHQRIARKLTHLCGVLESQFPGEKFLGCVDIQAVMERDVAYSSGLGWIGKNSMLINQKLGSFVFLAEILTTLEIEADKPVADHCGTCSKCIDVCPTDAIVSPRVVNASKCISYWTIESKTPAPEALSKNFGSQLFGCDLCQDVCPWNHLSRKTLSLPKATESGLKDVTKFLEKSEIKNQTKGTSMSRAKPERLQENARRIREIASSSPPNPNPLKS